MMKLGPYDLNTIVTGDARELVKAIPDESVDLIFTDPVYDRIEDYEWLAQTAVRVLRPEGVLLCWSGTLSIIDCANALAKRLLFQRLLTQFMYGARVGTFHGKFIIRTTPCLFFSKGRSQPYKTIRDINVSMTNKNKYGDYHGWGKSPDSITRWLDAFTHPGDIVFDPFTGGGTVPAVCKMLGRNYLAFEIEPETAEKARQRVEMTQPPLFVMQPEQLELIT